MRRKRLDDCKALVRGINFSDEPGGSLVFIDAERCDVIEFLTTSTVIVCDTPPLSDRARLGKVGPGRLCRPHFFLMFFLCCSSSPMRRYLIW